MKDAMAAAIGLPLPPPKGGGVAGSSWWQWPMVADILIMPARCPKRTATASVADRGRRGRPESYCHGARGSERKVTFVTTLSDSACLKGMTPTLEAQ